MLVVRSEQPGRHWFALSEVIVAVEIESPGSHLEDQELKPALYVRFGIPYYWRIELDPLLVTTYEIGHGDRYRMSEAGEHLKVTEPFEVDLPLADLLPRWAGQGESPAILEQN